MVKLTFSETFQKNKLGSDKKAKNKGIVEIACKYIKGTKTACNIKKKHAHNTKCLRQEKL